MADVGSTNIRLGAQIGGFLSGMRQASAATRDLTYQVNTNLTNSFRQSDAQARTFRGGLTRLGKDIQSVGMTMTGLVTLPAILGTGQAYKDFANLEKLQKGLDRFGVKLETVRDIAKLPNIGLFDGAKTLVGLRAVGVETEKATRLVKSFANAIAEAGGDATDLEPALFNIKQFLSTKNINQVDLRQLAARMPQTTQALQNAFGTSDATALNKIGVEKVVEGLLVELEKIPPVAAGASTAMDTFGDTMKVSSATLGQVADKTFDITGKINALGTKIEGAADSFRGMSATGQKTVLAFGLIAAAAGPVLFTIGKIVTLAPAMGAAISKGFTVAMGPVGVFVAVLAGVVLYQEEIRAGIADMVQGFQRLTGLPVPPIFKFLERVADLDARKLYDPMKAAKIPGLPDAPGAKVPLAQKYPFMGTAKVAIPDLSKANGGNKEYWEKEKKAAEEALEAMGAGEAGSAKWREIVAKIQNADKHLEKYTISTKEAKEEADKLTKAQMELWRIDLAGKWAKEREEVKSATEEYKKLVGVVASVEAEKKKARGMNFDVPDRLANNNETQTAGIKNRAAEIGQFQLPKNLVDEFAAQKDRIIGFNQDLQASFQNAFMGIAVGFGEMMGGVIAGTSGLQELPNMIGGLFGQMLKDIGKAFVATAIASSKFRVALIANPVLAVAAGVGMIAVGAALQNTVKKNKTPAFANGGFAYGDMMARVGDNPQARYDPEMIAPYSKVHDSIKKSVAESGTSGGGEWGLLEVKVRGEDIYHVYQRTDKRKRTIG